jgi:leucyl-tRNA synthetase
MPQWAGSCWYELRYLDPTNDKRWSTRRTRPTGWARRRRGDCGGVDLYVGGVEHAVLHLLYARFWHKVLFDLGHVSSGAVPQAVQPGLHPGVRVPDAAASYVPGRGGRRARRQYFYGDEEVTREYGKMGKSLKNVVTPDEMCEQYGADTFRVYEMAMGPLDVSRPWETRAVVGSQRFLQRVWRNGRRRGDRRGPGHRRAEPDEDDAAQAAAPAIDGVREDMDELRFNTAIAKLIELTNHVTPLREGRVARGGSSRWC